MTEWSEEVRARLWNPRFWNDGERHRSDIRAALGEIERLRGLGLERQEWRSRMGLSTQDEIVARAERAEAEVERLRMWEEAGKEYLADRDEMRKTLERTVVDSMRLGALLERAELVIPPGPLSREIRAALGEEGRP